MHIFCILQSIVTGPAEANSELVGESDQGLAKVKSTVSSITKQRVKLNIKVLGVQLGADQAKDQGQAAAQGGEKQTFREKFKPPEMSIVSKLMSKVRKVQVVDTLWAII